MQGLEATIEVERVTAEELAANLEAALRALGTPERAVNEKRYLKSDLVHYGVTVPKIRAATRSVCSASAAPKGELLRLVRLLWRSEVHECRMAAVEVLAGCVDQLGADDLPLIEQLLREAKTWAIVDGLATRVVGVLAEREPRSVAATLDRWAADPDFWLRRSSLLAHLPALRRGEGDLGRFERYADGMLGEQEFFIRKAIGWVLREAGRARPDEVAAWLEARIDRVSGVTLREAVKRLSPAHREHLLDAYRRR